MASASRFVGASVLLLGALVAADDFAKWKVAHGKLYSTARDEARARTAYLANDETIRKHNAAVPPPTFTLGHNALSDLDVHAYAATRLGHLPPAATLNATLLPPAKFMAIEGAPLADAIDWGKRGAVTPIKNQGACGGCWAFATTGAIESAFFISSGNLVSLSEEQLIACDFSAEGMH